MTFSPGYNIEEFGLWLIVVNVVGTCVVSEGEGRARPIQEHNIDVPFGSRTCS